METTVTRTVSQSVVNQRNDAISLVYDALALSHQILAENPTELPTQLYRRLLDSDVEGAKALLATVASETDWSC